MSKAIPAALGAEADVPENLAPPEGRFAPKKEFKDASAETKRGWFQIFGALNRFPSRSIEIGVPPAELKDRSFNSPNVWISEAAPTAAACSEFA